MKTGFCLLLVLLAAGCDSPGLSKRAKSPTAPAKQAVGQTETTGAAVPLGEGEGGPAVQTVGLSVSDGIVKACGIRPRAENKGMSTSFEYDSAALAEEDRKLLAEVAKCLTEGALRGRSVSLVGRADPRGEPEYNMTLGESRADTVRRYMIDLGVGRDRLMATSRGELDATGKDEAGWAQDRRVDVELAK
jgi:peptidoglycan-associated lipoprotein